MKSLLIKFITLILLMTVIYMPNNVYAESSTTIDDIMNGGDLFIAAGSTESKNLIDENALKSTSNLIYNILFVIAMATALIMGVILGIQFITGGVAEQAKVKESIIPYVVGVVVVTSAFAIWKLVSILLGNVAGGVL